MQLKCLEEEEEKKKNIFLYIVKYEPTDFL